MQTIFELQQLIETEIRNVAYPAHPAKLYDPIKYIMGLGGKRIRPVLLLLSSKLFNSDLSIALEAALAIEIFHNFTLVHDDIMDSAPLRRGKDTVHMIWGLNNAILSGDVMMVEANKHLTKLDSSVLKEALFCFNTTAQGVCEGQQLDTEFEQRNDVTIDEYINMIRLKTAVLVGGAMKLGAIVAGASHQDGELLYSFGENFGIAFQLQDDILDVYGDPAKFGKQVGGDIISNKQTFLLLRLKELATAEDLKLLEEQSDNIDHAAKVESITALYSKYQIREQAVTQMMVHQDVAFQALAQVSVQGAQKDEIENLAKSLIDRDH